MPPLPSTATLCKTEALLISCPSRGDVPVGNLVHKSLKRLGPYPAPAGPLGFLSSAPARAATLCNTEILLTRKCKELDILQSAHWKGNLVGLYSIRNAQQSNSGLYKCVLGKIMQRFLFYRACSLWQITASHLRKKSERSWPQDIRILGNYSDNTLLTHHEKSVAPLKKQTNSKLSVVEKAHQDPRTGKGCPSPATKETWLPYCWMQRMN